MVEVEGLGEVDVYPVGILRSMIDSRNELRAWSRHAVAVGPVHGYLRLTLRLMRSQVQQRKWHDLKNNFNGYLAEPRTWPEGGTLRPVRERVDQGSRAQGPGTQVPEKHPRFTTPGVEPNGDPWDMIVWSTLPYTRGHQ